MTTNKVRILVSGFFLSPRRPKSFSSAVLISKTTECRNLPCDGIKVPLKDKKFFFYCMRFPQNLFFFRLSKSFLKNYLEMFQIFFWPCTKNTTFNKMVPLPIEQNVSKSGSSFQGKMTDKFLDKKMWPPRSPDLWPPRTLPTFIYGMILRCRSTTLCRKHSKI